MWAVMMKKVVVLASRVVFVKGLVFGGYMRKKQNHINPLGLFNCGRGLLRVDKVMTVVP